MARDERRNERMPYLGITFRILPRRNAIYVLMNYDIIYEWKTFGVPFHHNYPYK